MDAGGKRASTKGKSMAWSVGAGAVHGPGVVGARFPTAISTST